MAILIANSLPLEGLEVRADPEGHWLWVKGKCFDKNLMLVHFYAPNVGQVEFFSSLLAEIEGNTEGTLVIAGDLNFAIEPRLDTRGASSMSGSKLRKFRRALASWQLLDPWRVLFPMERDYTFYSPVHQVYSRLYNFFVIQVDCDLVQKATIEVTTLSDHATYVLAWHGEGGNLEQEGRSGNKKGSLFIFSRK